MKRLAPWGMLIAAGVARVPDGAAAGPRLDGQHARLAFHTALNFDNTEAQRGILNSWVASVIAHVGPPSEDHVLSKSGLLSYLRSLMTDEIASMSKYAHVDIASYAGTRDFQCEHIRQSTPMNSVDGMWANMFVPDTVPRPYTLIVDKIRFEEQGEGDLKKNHPWMWGQTAASVGFEFPPVASRDFAYNSDFRDQSFWNAALTASVGRLHGWIPETLGMIAFLEMRSSASCHRQVLFMKHHGIDFSYYQVHRSIDNPHTGHGSQILDAIDDYMSGFASPEEEQEMALRIYKGYHSFEFTIHAVYEAIEEHLPTGGCPGKKSPRADSACSVDSNRSAINQQPSALSIGSDRFATRQNYAASSDNSNRSPASHQPVILGVASSRSANGTAPGTPVAYSTERIAELDKAMEQFIARHPLAYAAHRGPEHKLLQTPGVMVSYLRRRCQLFPAGSLSDTPFLRLFDFGGPMYGVGTRDDRALLQEFAGLNQYLCVVPEKA